MGQFDVNGFYNESSAHQERGYYHQDERDRAAALGCMGLLVSLVLLCIALGIAVCWSVAP